MSRSDSENSSNTLNHAPTGFVRLSGSAITGHRLTASSELFDADGLGVLRYQWLANGRVIEDGTGSTLEVKDDWLGKVLSVRVRYTDEQGHVETVFSANTAPVQDSVENEDSEAPENERLEGLESDDELSGAAGDDTLDGGVGADTLAGGLGDDVYYIDNLNDRVQEGIGAGLDKVISSISYTLGENLERLTLTGTAALNGMGNVLANQLTGNDGANQLSGNGGNDTLIGGSGDDVLLGGRGKDDLSGGIGHDKFKFTALADSSVGATLRDSVQDFVRGEDLIDLSTLDADTGRAGNQAFANFISSTAQFNKAGQLQLKQGVLYVNTDADSAAELSITLAGVSTLAMSDVIA